MDELERDIGDLAEVPEDQRLDYDDDDPNPDADELGEDFEVEEGEYVELDGGAA